MTDNKLKLVAVSSSLLLLSIFLVYASSYSPINEDSIVSHILPPDQYENLNLIAKSAYVFNPSTGAVLFTKNPETQLPLASITKVMSAIVVKENLANDIKISFDNDVWDLDDLLNYTLMVSSNEAATALAAAAASTMPTHSSSPVKTFISAMNEKAQDLGLNQTYFLDEAGLDVSDTQSGAYGSAQDVAHLFAYALKKIPTMLESTTVADTWFNTNTSNPHAAINTNKALGEIPGLIAGKTGYTDLAGGNLVVAFDPGMSDPVIAVVLGSTKEGRFEDIEKLVRAGLAK